MSPENLIGICGEPTTYRDDFRGFEVKKIEHDDFQDRKNVKPKKVNPVFAESHDTFQKLDYDSRLPFDALWQLKDIDGTDPRDPVCRKSHQEENESLRVARTKPTKLISPAVSLDDVNDAETRKLIANYLYQSTVSRAAKEVWRNFESSHDKYVQEQISEEFGDSIPEKTKIIPPDFENAAKKWDSLQNRRLVDRTNIKEIHCPSRFAETNTSLCKKYDHKRAISELIKDGKEMRLPYEKLPLSYGGHRTSIALGVPILKKKLSPYHPDLTVSQAAAARKC